MDDFLHKKFTVSQFAAMHNVNKRTLMYYDEIGLFSPEEVRKNGYRYYTFRQSIAFSAILLLRKMQVPLRDIASYLNNYTQKGLLELLRGQDRILDEKMHELLWLKKIVKNKINKMESQQATAFLTIKAVTEKARPIVLSKDVQQMPIEQAVALAASFIGDCYKNQTYSGYPLGLLLDGAAFNEKGERLLKNFFFPSGEKKDVRTVCQKPSGRYLVGYYRGRWDDLGAFYEQMRRRVRDGKLMLGENIYEERIIDDVAAESPDYSELKISIQLA